MKFLLNSNFVSIWHYLNIAWVLVQEFLSWKLCPQCGDVEKQWKLWEVNLVRDYKSGPSPCPQASWLSTWQVLIIITSTMMPCKESLSRASSMLFEFSTSKFISYWTNTRLGLPSIKYGLGMTHETTSHLLNLSITSGFWKRGSNCLWLRALVLWPGGGGTCL